jgi:hypothetical protein
MAVDAKDGHNPLVRVHTFHGVPLEFITRCRGNNDHVCRRLTVLQRQPSHLVMLSEQESTLGKKPAVVEPVFSALCSALLYRVICSIIRLKKYEGLIRQHGGKPEA